MGLANEGGGVACSASPQLKWTSALFALMMSQSPSFTYSLWLSCVQMTADTVVSSAGPCSH